MAYREEDPEIFLREMGWTYRVSGDNFELDCPLCGKKKKFYMSRYKPLWDCKSCGDSGNIYQLRGKVGLQDIRQAGDVHAPPEEKPKEPIDQKRIDSGKAKLEADKDAWNYLTEKRGFDPKVIRGMSLILEEAYGARWIGFPWRYKGKWQGMKFRILEQDRRTRVVDGKEKDSLPRFRREAGYRSILYNRDVLDLQENGGRKFTKVVLCSGETDLLSLYSMGYRAVVATTTGETAMPDHEIDELKKLERVWVLYDNDKVGLESSKKIARRIGLDRAYVVRLPEEINDANEFMRKRGEHAKKEMDLLMRQSFRMNVPTVQQVTEVVEQIREGFQRDGNKEAERLTPWTALNKHLAKLNGLVVLSAPQGTGKTTFGLQLAAYWAKERSAPALFYCMEMTPQELVTKTIFSEFRLSADPQTGDWEDLDGFEVNKDEVLREFAITWENVPMYVGFSGVAKKPKEIIELLRQAVHRYELQILFFDNIHVFRGDDRVQRIGEFSAACKEISMELEIPVVVIAQPKKMDMGRMMNPWDLAYSSDLFSDADNMIFLHRQQPAAQKDTEVFKEEAPETNFSPFTVVRIAKSRFGVGRDVLLYLEGASHHFRDCKPDEVIEYRGPRGGHRTTTVGSVGFGGTKPKDQDGSKGSEPERERDEDLPF